MTVRPLRMVVFGLSLSSSWGNGHATTYRALLKALAERGHDILFLERDCPWYAEHRDLKKPAYCRLALYRSLSDLRRFRAELADADVVIVGSFVPDGVAVGRWVQQNATGITAFYDIDTPVTLAKLKAGQCEYLSPAMIPGYDLYLSFTGGPVLPLIEEVYGSPAARVLYCSVDPAVYSPKRVARRWELGYLGTYGADRQPALERLLIEPAKRAPDLRFVVAGSLYPADLEWPQNVERIEHLAPEDHAEFYSSLGWALNVTRADMVAAGFSPSVRLFEASACGAPIISDGWPGLDQLFTPSKEIAVASSAEEVLKLLDLPEHERGKLAAAGRRRLLAGHTAHHRALELESYLALVERGRSRRPTAAGARTRTPELGSVPQG